MTHPVRPTKGSQALVGLPLCDPAEIEDATGFSRTVRSLVTVPLTCLGLLASVAALSVGNLLAATLALAATLGVVVSLVRDTRLSTALDRLRRGQLAKAEQGMNRLVAPRAAADRQRGRAEAYLAAIAWARGRHPEALQWTRARRTTLERVGAAADERFLNDASVVLLLALQGEVAAARDALGELEVTPPGERYAAAEAAAHLSLAFARDDVDGLRSRIDGWYALRSPGAPLVTAWIAWALARLGRTEDARAAAQLALPRRETIAVHAPRLADWLGRFDAARLQYRQG